MVYICFASVEYVRDKEEFAVNRLPLPPFPSMPLSFVSFLIGERKRNLPKRKKKEGMGKSRWKKEEQKGKERGGGIVFCLAVKCAPNQVGNSHADRTKQKWACTFRDG
jgi:hypothetical protein